MCNSSEENLNKFKLLVPNLVQSVKVALNAGEQAMSAFVLLCLVSQNDSKISFLLQDLNFLRFLSDNDPAIRTMCLQLVANISEFYDLKLT